MPGCTLEIELKEPWRVRLPGQPLIGHVAVRAAGLLDGRLELEHSWRARGPGLEERGRPSTHLLAEGRLETGEEDVFDFELACLPGPFSYAGALFEVQWFLRARLTDTGGVMAEVEQVYPLEPNLDEREIARIEAPLVSVQAPPQLDTTSRCFAWLLGVVPSLLGLGLIAAGLTRAWDTAGPADQTETIVRTLLQLPAGALACALGAAVCFGLWRRRQRAHLLGPLTIELSNTALRPGEELGVALSLCPREQVQLQRASASLSVSEEVLDGQRSQRWRGRRLCETSAELLPSGTCRAETELSGAVSLRLPASAPFTHMGEHHRLRCSVELVVQVADAPVRSAEFEIWIVP